MTVNRFIPERLYGVVDAGSASTPYVRAGSGSTVVLLLARALDVDATGSALFAELSTCYRVIALQLPAIPTSTCAGERNEIASWLRDALDGLGIDRANLVMDDELVCSTLSFTVADSARIAAIVLLSREAHAPVADLEMCLHTLTQNYPAILHFRLRHGEATGVDDVTTLHQLLRST